MSKASASPAAVERQRRIVEAAVRLFANAPYASVRMDEIASAASVAKPTLYRYFPTKETLFIASLEWTLNDVRTELQSIEREPISVDLKLRRFIAAILKRIEQIAPALHAIENRSPEWGAQSRRVLREGFRNLRAEISNLVRDGTQKGEFGAIDPALASLVILGGLRMAAHSRTGRGGALADTMADILLGGLRGGQVPARSPLPPSVMPTPSGATA
jgi:AcrR family transcriptional regulator